MNKLITQILMSAITASFVVGDEVKVTILDENSLAVEGAKTTVTFLGYGAETTTRKIGETNDKGIYKAQGEALLRMSVQVEKDGYYSAHSGRLKRNENHDVSYILKKKKKPIPLYAKKYKIIAPVLGKPLGYDFKLGDWVSPNGKGETIDVLFNVDYKENGRLDYTYKLAVTFPNPLDGIKEFRGDNSSVFIAPHEAPLKGYKKNWLQQTQATPELGRSGNRDPQRNYWLRTRTATDESGNIVSANYVKIYGDFPEIQYYFNPTPNDRNLEFALNKNLFKKLTSSNSVKKP